MHIVFDMAYDQSVAPDSIAAGQATIGKLFVGPNGLLNVLETHLGLTGKETHHAMRIQGYMDCMKQVLGAPGAVFFVNSYASDSWSSAKQMLAWRDKLMLAAALHHAGLPMLGNDQRSPWRAALQILPLALANVWKPLDIQALLSFLSLPYSPVPRFAARLLRGAIQNEPGVGGERWQQAEKKIIEFRKQQLIGKEMQENQEKGDATL